MNLKPWQKTALALTAISVFAGAGYTAYYFFYKKRKEKEEAEKLASEKPEEKPVFSTMPVKDIKDVSVLIKDTRTIQTNNQQKG